MYDFRFTINEGISSSITCSQMRQIIDCLKLRVLVTVTRDINMSQNVVNPKSQIKNQSGLTQIFLNFTGLP